MEQALKIKFGVEMNKEKLAKKAFKYVVLQTQDRIQIGYDLVEDHLTLKYLGIDAKKLPVFVQELQIY